MNRRDPNPNAVHHAPWEMVDFPDLSMDEIAQICQKNSIGNGSIVKLRPTGVINTVYFLGDRLVLRVPKPTPEGISDTYTESVAAPIAHDSGISTPKLVVFDDDRDIVDVPYTVYERVEGKNPDILEMRQEDLEHVFLGLGRDLARLHNRVDSVSDPDGHLDHPERQDPEKALVELSRRKLLDVTSSAWLTRIFSQLQPAIEESSNYSRFLHNDTQPANIMCRGNQYVGLIDWGDAGWGDPALELRHMPIRFVPATLDGYLQIDSIDGADTIWDRILWDHLSWALERSVQTAGMQPCDWSAPPLARLMDLLTFSLSLNRRHF